MSVRLSSCDWLLLTFTLPTKHASKRVEIWRKLQRYGTSPLGNSGYLLPNDVANEERFQWLARAIRKYSGEASIVRVQSIDNLSKQQLKSRFVEARTRDYQQLLQQIRALPTKTEDQSNRRALGRLRSRFQDIVEVDFFVSPLQARVRESLEQASSAQSGKVGIGAAKMNIKEFKNRLWVTRPRPGVDRCASAWLINRFIDPKARFLFLPEGEVPEHAVAFDMFHERGFGHRGTDCTFETLEKEFRIRDPRVAVIGQIVHDADLLDDRFGHKQGYGVDEVLKGWARMGLSDAKLLERGMQLVEGLYHLALT
jgi:hypothetical protein